MDYSQEPTAENLALRARQVGRPGLGMAPPEPQALPQQQQPLIDPRQHPLGAAGLVLSNVAAGMRGDTLPTDRLKQQNLQERQMRAEEQQLQAKSSEIALNVIEHYSNNIGSLPPEEQEAALDHMQQSFQGAAPNINLKLLTQSAAKMKGAQRQQFFEALKGTTDPKVIKLVTALVEAGTPPEHISELLLKSAMPTEPKDDRTAAEKDAIALGYTRGSKEFNNYIRERTLPRAPQNNINVESAPRADYQFVRDVQGKVIREDVIPGSKTATDLAAASEKEAAGRQSEAIQTGLVTQDIDRALNMMENSSIPLTGVFAAAKAIGGTPQANLAQLLKGISANVTFDKLAEMRKNSPTGAALGNVTEGENRLLASVKGSLEQEQGYDQLRFNLSRLKFISRYMINKGTPEDVRTALQNGLLTKDQAAEFIKTRFGAKTK